MYKRYVVMRPLKSDDNKASESINPESMSLNSEKFWEGMPANTSIQFRYSLYVWFEFDNFIRLTKYERSK